MKPVRPIGVADPVSLFKRLFSPNHTIKVPFRNVYCWGWKIWLKEVIWCHLVMRLFPRASELPPCESEPR